MAEGPPTLPAMYRWRKTIAVVILAALALLVLSNVVAILR
ncbi:MAG: hypothetical protein JWO68_952 [Actinomycetia bacterium]|nr:hypothetical protein [Actinomycetes bacterium]